MKKTIFTAALFGLLGIQSSQAINDENNTPYQRVPGTYDWMDGPVDVDGAPTVSGIRRPTQHPAETRPATQSTKVSTPNKKL